MRVPVDVLERVRGAVMVAALAACTTEPAATPPPVVPEPPASIAIPAPVDPVHYEAANESARLARLDIEERGALASRDARVAHIAAERRAEERQQLGRIGYGRLSPGACMACGRG